MTGQGQPTQADSTAEILATLVRLTWSLAGNGKTMLDNPATRTHWFVYALVLPAVAGAVWWLAHRYAEGALF